MKIAVALTFLSSLAVSSAQDLAPESLADMVYATRATNPSGTSAPLPHAAVLSSDGSRTQINISGFQRFFSAAGYTWTKTSANTGTLALTGVPVPSRLEVTFTSSGKGTYREVTDGSGAVVLGEISFAPVPRDATPPLLNVSVRTTLAPGQTAIEGFVVSGSSRRVLVRAIGPSLALFGVTNAVATPSLTLFKGASQIGANTGWGGTPSLAAVFSAVGAFALPPTSRDCAVVLTLEPGNYTAHARADGPGEVLLEVYFVD